ncbi:helix-turn-helix domain-containing protein [Mesorhizobium sp. AD1-1]|uniref:helix-turn-helix transcriptional regulator n=1 Tax=Mesorhizobium sp. AD1-1 TaxID=2876621 RepID=UPI001CCDD0CC|nr:helix-turn-helix domain-containing protein [Mesorhizobium sp. AD1-1]MBZ9717050.1 helix-turn-helix domain-containing protein [Mesorhizobium sp. AD1-1]
MQSIYNKEVRLSRPEAADYLDVSIATLARWASQKIGPIYVKVGRHTRYPLSGLDDFLDARTFAGRQHLSGNRQ